MTDADIDGSHIATLSYLPCFRYMKGMVNKDCVHCTTTAVPGEKGKEQQYAWTKNSAGLMWKNWALEKR